MRKQIFVDQVVLDHVKDNVQRQCIGEIRLSIYFNSFWNTESVYACMSRMQLALLLMSILNSESLYKS